MNDYILTLSCPDRTGIVHNVSGWLLEQNGNILEAQQFGDAATNRFFLRIQFSLPEKQDVNALQAGFAPIAEKFGMEANIYDAQRKARLLILVSRQGHCLNDLLFRAHSGQLPVEIAAVASNHTDHAGLASSYGIPFHHLPVTPETRPEQEQQRKGTLGFQACPTKPFDCAHPRTDHPGQPCHSQGGHDDHDIRRKRIRIGNTGKGCICSRDRSHLKVYGDR